MKIFLAILILTLVTMLVQIDSRTEDTSKAPKTTDRTITAQTRTPPSRVYSVRDLRPEHPNVPRDSRNSNEIQVTNAIRESSPDEMREMYLPILEQLELADDVQAQFLADLSISWADLVTTSWRNLKGLATPEEVDDKVNNHVLVPEQYLSGELLDRFQQLQLQAQRESIAKSHEETERLVREYEDLILETETDQ